MFIAPKEMPKVMQNKYATKSMSNPASPERPSASMTAKKSAAAQDEEQTPGGKRTRIPSFKKEESMSQQVSGPSLGLKSKRDGKQAGRKDSMIARIGRTKSLVMPSPASQVS